MSRCCLEGEKLLYKPEQLRKDSAQRSVDSASLTLLLLARPGDHVQVGSRWHSAENRKEGSWGPQCLGFLSANLC